MKVLLYIQIQLHQGKELYPYILWKEVIPMKDNSLKTLVRYAMLIALTTVMLWLFKFPQWGLKVI